MKINKKINDFEKRLDKPLFRKKKKARVKRVNVRGAFGRLQGKVF